MAAIDTARVEAQRPTRCVASITNNVNSSESEEHVRRTVGSRHLNDAKNNYFKSAEWTADGTSIITNSADNHIRTYIVPPDLLAERQDPLSLTAYSALPAAESVNAVTSYPLFNLQDPSTTLLLSTIRDHPVHLNSALTPQLAGSYPLVNPTTEAFMSPHSLLFTPDGAKFVAGSDSLLSIFDLSRPGESPMSWLPTGRKRGSRSAESGMSMRGIVSALAIESGSAVLAAGTFSRNIGLYGSEGQGDCVGVFSVEGTEADELISGRGVTQVIWSPCGRYLYIVERKSDGAMIYDIRKTGQLLGWLEGRKAMTNQRLAVSIVSTTEERYDGYEVWAGGTDGRIRAWRNPHSSEGPQQPDSEWEGHHSAVSSVSVHPGGAVVASSSGERQHSKVVDLSDTESLENDVLERAAGGELDNSLRIWAL